MASCNQCGKPAVRQVNGNPLCVDCFLKLQTAIQIQNDMYARELNLLTDEMETIAGVRGILPRYEVSQPLIHRGPLTLQNINHSVVGMINTSENQRIEIQRIDVFMGQLKDSGQEELVQALKEFTEAVISETKLNEELKEELIEQISFITEQSTLPKKGRKTGLVKAILEKISKTVDAFEVLHLLWVKLYPLLEKVFFPGG